MILIGGFFIGGVFGYAWDMNKVFFFLLLVISMPVMAEVYTWVGADGNRHYGDRPPESGTSATKVPESVYASPAVGWVSESLGPVSEESPKVESGYYKSIEILRPANDDSVRNTNGDVQVVIYSDPPLRRGDLFTLYLDNEVVYENFSGDVRILNGVDRGTHTLRVSIFGRDAKPLISSEPTTFHLHSPSRLFKNRNQPNPPPTDS